MELLYIFHKYEITGMEKPENKWKIHWVKELEKPKKIEAARP